MDAATYPADSVKKFLGGMVVMKINPEAGKDTKKIADQFDVNSYPRLIMLSPKGEAVQTVKGGLETPDEFLGEWGSDAWNEYVEGNNAKPQDVKKMAHGLFTVVAWFPDGPNGAKAKDAKDKLKDDAAFKTEWDALQKTHDREILAAKADAQIKLGKKKDATETYKKLATDFPDDKEGKDAAAALKKMGVKVEPPAEPKK